MILSLFFIIISIAITVISYITINIVIIRFILNRIYCQHMPSPVAVLLSLAKSRKNHGNEKLRHKQHEVNVNVYLY